MTPGKYDITIFRGSTWFVSLEAEAIDFSDYDEIRMQIRPPWIKGLPIKPPLLLLDQDNGRITLSEDKINLTISAADTAGLYFDEGIYDLELVKHETADAVEVVDKLIYGSVQVKGEVTV